MWIVFAFASALFAGVTAILAKCGIKNMDSNVATAIRTVVVLIFSWLMVLVAGSLGTISGITGKTFLFLVLSGMATGASWLCYFKALQLGDINKVTPIDKSSTVITMLLAFIFLKESLSFQKVLAMAFISAGTFFMLKKEKTAVKNGQGIETLAADFGGRRNHADADMEPAPVKHNFFWLLYAFGSAVFASLTAILGKLGIEGVESNLGTAIRTAVVLVMAWMMVFITGKQGTVKDIDKRSWLFLILSGIATGSSWLCYYRALQTGPASVVVPIDKLSILVTILFSYLVFHETLSKRAWLGLLMIVAGTLLLLLL